MADVKISQLTALASASSDVAADVLAIVDTSVPQTKKITIENLVSPITLDKSNSRVGIGATSPDTLLNLKDAGSIEVRLEADSNNSGQEDCFIRFYTDGKTQEGIVGMDNNNSSSLFTTNTENAMVFGCVSNLPVVFATNNTERMQISADGKMFIGSTSSRALSGVTPQMQIEGTDYGTSSMSLIGNTGTDAGTCPLLMFGRSRGTSDGTSTAVVDGDRLGAIFFTGADGTDINTVSAYIEARVDGSVSGNTMPGRIQFYTNSGGSSASEKMRITSSGKVGIGTDSPAGDLEITAGDGQVSNGVYLSNNRNTNNNEFIYFRKANSTSVPSDTWTLGEVGFQAWDGDEYHTAARIDSRVEGTISNNAPVGNFIFLTADGSDPNPAERMRISSAGRVGINKNSPNAKLDINETTNGQELIFLNHSVTGANQTYIQFRHDGTQRGNIQVNDSNDQIVYNTSVSDKRLKKDFEDWDESILPAFKSLKPQLFNFKNSENKSGKSKGYIAQDNVDNFPEAYTASKFLDDDDTEYYSFNPSGMVSYLMKAVQELSAKIEELEGK